MQRDDPSPELYRRLIAGEIEEMLGAPGTTRVERVDRIPVDPSGKLHHVVSLAAAAGRPRAEQE
ncbi:MAG: hypothetical protein U0R69_13600 [Gaiellales bacterium]